MCNGWSNYQTWTVAMWFGDFYAELAGDYTPDQWEGDVLKALTEELLVNDGSWPDTGFAADVMNDFMREVDWDELADHYIPETEETEEESEISA